MRKRVDVGHRRGRAVASASVAVTLRSTSSIVGALLACLLGACVSVPEAEPLQFAVDDAELRDGAVDRTIERVAAALRDDPALHLLIVGHADEDNTDEYNRALSRRRAEHARDRIVAIDAELAERLHIEARGEWDASDPGIDEAAKARNRRVELRFYYPRQCEPSFDAEFLACEWSRLPAPDSVIVETTPPLTEPEPAPPVEPPPVRPREGQDFRGPYVFGLGGYALSSGEYLLHHARYGVGAGYLWGFGSDFRVAAGLNFDHMIDIGFVFPTTSCQPFCEEVDRSRIRIVPELRVGGARGGVWAWLRLSAGVSIEHHEARLQRNMLPEGTQTVEIAPARWTPGAVLGLGPGVAITLTRHLFLLLDATVTYGASRGTSGTGWSGLGIYDAGAGLGWIF
jgi:hypothetical protein